MINDPTIHINTKLIFTVTFNQNLGYLIEGFVVNVMQNGQFSIAPRKINLKNLKNYNLSVSDNELKILKIIDEYSEDNIVKKFSKKYTQAKEFFESIEESFIQQQIKPFIDRKTINIISILSENNINLYFKGKNKDYVDERKINIVKNIIDVTFNFIKTESEFKYYLTLTLENKEIELNKNSFVLTNFPCFFFYDFKLLCLTDKVDGKKITPFFTKDFISIPQKNEKQYFENFVLKALKNFNVNASGFEVKNIHPEIETFLKLDTDWQSDTILVLSFKYGDIIHNYHDKLNFDVKMYYENDKYSFTRFGRSIEFEQNIVRILTELGLEIKENSAFIIKSYKIDFNQNLIISKQQKKYETINWINKNENILAQNNIKIEQSKKDVIFHTGIIDIDIRLSDNYDWFDIHGYVIFDEFKIPFIKLKNNILSNNREFVLPNNKIAVIPEEWFAKYRETMMLGDIKDNKIRINKQHFTLIPEIEPDNKINDSLIQNLVNLKFVDLPEIPKKINATLRIYQHLGYAWMYFLNKNKLGGCLADDMGLGKTIQTLSLVCKSLEEENFEKHSIENSNKQLNIFELDKNDSIDIKTSLIVMPLSLIHNWINEINKFCPSLKVYAHTGFSRITEPELFYNFDLVLTTFGTLRSDFEFFNSLKFNYLIIDEAQFIKNPYAKIYLAICNIKAVNKIALTGTPIENSLTDLWAIMSFLNKNILGSLSFFEKNFIIPIEKFKDESKKESLKKIIKPFILRRTKVEVEKDLPELTERIYYCEMSEEQKSIYEEYKSSVRNVLLENIEKFGFEKSKVNIFNALLNLRLIANHPVLFDKETNSESGKFLEIVRNIESLISENHKVLIFSQFVKHLNIFKQYFNDKNLKYSYLIGKSKSEQRESEIFKFQNDENNRLFLISLTAGGFGLNLTSADYVFILDPWWNPAKELQALSRSHRIGQKNHVVCYKFITSNSIEEKILKLQDKKRNLSEDFINSNNALKYFTKDDFFEIIE